MMHSKIIKDFKKIPLPLLRLVANSNIDLERYKKSITSDIVTESETITPAMEIFYLGLMEKKAEIQSYLASKPKNHPGGTKLTGYNKNITNAFKTLNKHFKVSNLTSIVEEKDEQLQLEVREETPKIEPQYSIEFYQKASLALSSDLKERLPESAIVLNQYTILYHALTTNSVVGYLVRDMKENPEHYAEIRKEMNENDRLTLTKLIEIKTSIPEFRKRAYNMEHRLGIERDFGE